MCWVDLLTARARREVFSMNRLTHEQRVKLETAEHAANSDWPVLTGDPNIDGHVLAQLCPEERHQLAEILERNRQQGKPVFASDIEMYRISALTYLYQAPEILETLQIALAQKEADIQFMKDRPIQYDSLTMHKAEKQVLELKEKIYGVYARLEAYQTFLEAIKK